MYPTSRSAIECYRRCPAKRLWQYHYNETGIVPVRRNIALLQGIAVHKGVEDILRQWLTIGDNIIDEEAAITKARLYFQEEGLRCLVDGKGTQTREQQIWTIAEGRALVEAQLRLWSKIELPKLRKYYKLVCAEKETQYSLGNDIILQSRLDAVFQDASSNYYGYSLKTGKEWSQRSELAFSIDLQTLTETFVASKTLGYRLAGTLFCHLIKGKREENSNTGNWETANPFIKGYRSAGIGEMGYAHSYWFPNPANPSGKGRLGNKWSPFHVWSNKDGYPGGVKQWIEDIWNKKIQPEVNTEELFANWCVSLIPIFRSSAEMNLVMEQVARQEQVIFHHLYKAGTYTKDVTFPMYQHSCVYPTPCEYMPLCHGIDREGKAVGDIKNDPIGSGLYEIRIPHHEMLGE